MKKTGNQSELWSCRPIVRIRTAPAIEMEKESTKVIFMPNFSNAIPNMTYASSSLAAPSRADR